MLFLRIDGVDRKHVWFEKNPSALEIGNRERRLHNNVTTFYNHVIDCAPNLLSALAYHHMKYTSKGMRHEICDKFMARCGAVQY